MKKNRPRCIAFFMSTKKLMHKLSSVGSESLGFAVPLVINEDLMHALAGANINMFGWTIACRSKDKLKVV